MLTSLALLWLYAWGVYMNGVLMKYAETMKGEKNPSPHWIGAMLWPILLPFAWVRQRLAA